MEFYEHKIVAVEDLIPYALNSRTHSDEQVAQLAASIREFGFTNPVLIDQDANLIAGHGRLLAARKAKMDQVPAVVVTGLDDRKRRALVIADNKLALNAGWDEEALRVELEDLAGDFGELMGFSEDELVSLLKGESEGGEGDSRESGLSENYSRKIEAPIYEITGKCPAIPEMMDRAKTETLQAEIDRVELPDDVRAFLHFAAERHTVFNFRNIAEFYAHADAGTQDLMERSALVIIDFDRAIEEGFVSLAQGLMEQVRGIKQDADAA